MTDHDQESSLSGDFLGKALQSIVPPQSGSGIPADEYSALNLAYMGDAVFELCVRARLTTDEKIPVRKLHLKARELVNAVRQARMYDRLMEPGILCAEEAAVIKRGRNAKSFSRAKHASVLEYRHATGVEALFGYLFLRGEHERVMEVFDICMRE